MLAVSLFRMAGVPVRFHWSFVTVPFFVAFYAMYHSLIPSDVFALVAFLGALFMSITLHEFGHAGMAIRLGVAPVDIIISPIGGVVRLRQLTCNAWEQAYIMVAGPFVNLLIAGILFLGMYFYVGDETFFVVSSGVEQVTTVSGFLGLLIWANILLFALNMLPIYPFDGGRAIRAILGSWIGQVPAIKWMMVISAVLTAILAAIGYSIGDYAVTILALVLLVIALLSGWRKLIAQNVDTPQ